MSAEDLTYSVDPVGVATIRFARPQSLNALTSEMIEELLPAACSRATRSPDVRVVVITGTGRGFCSGADVSERLGTVAARDDAAAAIGPLGAFAYSVWSIPKPVIAAVNGVAAGGGMSLAAAADFRIMVASARYVPAFLRRGLMPDSGLTFTLPRLVGVPKATDILMTGRAVGAMEALRIGLADQVVSDELFDSAVDTFAHQLAEGPAAAMSFTKRALQRAGGGDFLRQLDFESWGQSQCFKSEEFVDGIREFSEKRSQKFRG